MLHNSLYDSKVDQDTAELYCRIGLSRQSVLIATRSLLHSPGQKEIEMRQEGSSVGKKDSYDFDSAGISS